MYYWINNLYEQGDTHLTPIFFKDGHLCLKGRTIFVPNFLYPSVSLWISLLHFISPFLCLYMLYLMCACVCSLCAFICFMYIVLCACMCFLLACALVKIGGMQFIPYFITPHLVVKDEFFFSIPETSFLAGLACESPIKHLSPCCECYMHYSHIWLLHGF